MIKIKYINLYSTYIMSLSKNNLDKLNSLIKKENSVKNNFPKNDNTFKNLKNSHKFNDPNNIFYSIIDNSYDLDETSEANNLLKNSEDNLHNLEASKTNLSIGLSNEDKLYDEFNYLLDE